MSMPARPRGEIEIRKRFTFEAAHRMPFMPEGHAYERIHGHSFEAEIALAGIPDEQTGWVADLGDIASALSTLRGELDHRLLNDVPGLETPTLEHLAQWIAARLQPDFPSLRRVTVGRPSCGESCCFTLSPPNGA